MPIYNSLEKISQLNQLERKLQLIKVAIDISAYLRNIRLFREQDLKNNTWRH